MKHHHYKRSKLATVCSWRAYEWLMDWIKEKHPQYPYSYDPNKYFYNNTSHREYLSKFIEDVMTKVLKGHGADPQKPPDKGRMIRKNGKQIYIKQRGVKAGRADIVCFFNGKMYNLEVKVGKDKMSEEQIKEQQRALQNGEEYVIIKTVDDFLKIYDVSY